MEVKYHHELNSLKTKPLTLAPQEFLVGKETISLTHKGFAPTFSTLFRESVINQLSINLGGCILAATFKLLRAYNLEISHHYIEW